MTREIIIYSSKLVFEKCYFPVADTYCDSHDGKRTLLLKLMKFCEVDVNFLHSVCQDLTFDFQECLLLYLEHTLLTWEAHFEETVNPMTDKSGIYISSSLKTKSKL